MAMVIAALAGCTHVIARTTPYYEDGPSQLDPPQGELEAGTYVLVVGKEGTYSRVWTVGGVDAYVLDGDLESVWQWWRRKGRPPFAEPERRSRHPSMNCWRPRHTLDSDVPRI